MDNLLTSFLDLLFPNFCVGCAKRGYVICEKCLTVVPLNTSYKCIICDIPTTFGFTHAACLSTNSPNLLTCAFNYDSFIKIAIHKAKYDKKVFNILNFLAKLSLETVIKNPDFPLRDFSNFIIIPIPLHKTKLNERGFNQCDILAKSIAKVLEIPMYSNVLIKTIHTPSQTTFSREERFINVKDAYKCNSSIIQGKNIVLVDDVCTSGATFLAASTALKNQGANFIWCFAVAHAI